MHHFAIELFTRISFCLILQPPNKSQNHYSEPDNRDWRGRSAQFPSSGEEKTWESLRENREFGSRFDSRQQDSNHFNHQDQHGRMQAPANQVVLDALNVVIILYVFLKLSSNPNCMDVHIFQPTKQT